MGQHRGVEYAEDVDDFGDATGSEYATAKAKTPEWIFGVGREAGLRADAAAEAAETVRVQAARALIGHGMTVREAARYLGLSKSRVARLAWGRAWRREPQPDIDRLVQDVWDDGLQTNGERLLPREGDQVRRYNMNLNIMSSEGELQ